MLLTLTILAVIVGFLITQIASIATTIYLHRSLTHSAFALKKPSEMVFRIICWFITGTIPREWVAVHRKHHAFTDIEGDPHSPKINGFWKVQLLNTWYYRQEARKIDLKHWARGIPDYGWLDRHDMLGLAAGFVLGYLTFGLIATFFGWNFFLGGLFGLLAATLHMIFYIFLSAMINAYCHVRGYKTFPDADAYNSRLVALITTGEGLHNNHHKHQRSPILRTGDRWGETDFGWVIIKFLDKIGQVKNKSEFWPK
jgi:stearoyl-CoA desaturase (delta-9 desaturase)